jgi:hypothetical protein
MYDNPDSPNKGVSKISEAYFMGALGENMWQRGDGAILLLRSKRANGNASEIPTMPRLSLLAESSRRYSITAHRARQSVQDSLMASAAEVQRPAIVGDSGAILSVGRLDVKKSMNPMFQRPAIHY